MVPATSSPIAVRFTVCGGKSLLLIRVVSGRLWLLTTIKAGHQGIFLKELSSLGILPEQLHTLRGIGTAV